MSRILNMITRGILRATSAVTGGKFRSATVSMSADSPDFVDHFQLHGLESRPRAGADALVFAASGNAEHLVALIAGTSELTLTAEEAAVYNDFGWSAELRETKFEVIRQGASRLKVQQSSIDIGTSPTKAAARVDDAVALAFGPTSWAGKVTAAINALAPGTIASETPTGTITSGSTKVNIE